jgi:hypothetical protein
MGVKTSVLLKDTPLSVGDIIFSNNIEKGLYTFEYQDFVKNARLER